ncbi:MAG: GNAT family N-acetyltransferase [Planctomycetaceae bacterium]|nr:GNAT family N-acetyltransferase [Planctomycetaceae bacterium]
MSTLLADTGCPAETACRAERDACAPVAVEWWDSTRRAEAIAVWFALEQQLGGLPVMCSADWTDAWLRHYGSIVSHRFAVGRVAGRIVGVILLTRGVEDHDGWFASRAWHLGTAGEPDADSVCIEYNALACEPAYRDAFFDEVIRQLQTEPDWDELCCDGFAVHDLPEVSDASTGWMQDRRMAWWTNLERVRESGRELVQFFGISTRRHIRQNLRDYGTVTVEQPQSFADAHAFFDEMVDLHQARWTQDGQPGCYASRAFTALHRELIDRMVGDGRTLLLRVRANNVTLGCTQFFIDRGRALNYQGGRLTNSGRLSPGLITDYCCMQFCLERGYSAYDFMAGDSQHKQRLSTDTTPLSWRVCRRPRLKFTIMNQLRKCKQLIAALSSHESVPVAVDQVPKSSPQAEGA